MATKILEGFSVSHAAILDGATGAELVNGDIYGVNEASLDLDSDSYDNEGDDTVLSSWAWMNYATLTVQGGYIPFDLLAVLTGEAVTTTGVAPADIHKILLWSQASLNVAPKPVLIRMPAKDSNGVPRTLDIVLFKVQFDPISFDGPSYKEGLKLNYRGKALLSTIDETGAPLAGGARAVGRLVHKQ